MGFYALFAVFSGAGLGAVLRWLPGLLLNLLFPTAPRGTLAANLLGGYLIGVTVVFFN
jgi:CrcB protein